MPSRTGARSSDFSILRVAEGGMGYVELIARQEGRFSRLFARKRLHPALRSDPTFRSMFLDEARLAGLLQHRNVTAAIEIGEDADGPFLLMDYVDGVTVAQLLERVDPDHPLPVALCVAIVAQAARGLHAAHCLAAPDGTPLAVVHRDISPKNLLLGYDGWLRVSDFGIAKAKDNLEQTLVGVLKGNIGYMAPEVLSFQPVDHRSDLFALGVVLYELLTRERLYGGTDASAVARRILQEPPPDVFEVRDLPPELCALSFDLLAKDRELRPPSAVAVATQLEEIGNDLAAVEGPFDIAAFLEHELRDVRQEHKAKLEVALSNTAGSIARATLRLGLRRRAWRALAAVIGVLVVAAVTWGFWRAHRAVSFEPGAHALWAGGWHTCALHDARLVCWGRNERGQLGEGTRESRSAPAVVSIGAVRAASLQELATCALDGNGTVFCWGRNTKGEIGSPTPRLIEHPVEVAGLGPASELASGRQHTCALLAGGKVNCWGANDYGQLGRPPSADIGAPGEVRDLPPAVQIFAGGANTCARLANLELVCWGANESGQLRDGTLEDRFTPMPIAGGPEIVSLAIGNNGRAGTLNPDRANIVSFMCAAERSGSVSCWGSNHSGQLGDGTRERRAAPVAVGGIFDAIWVAAGDLHACALHRSGAVSCWGRNEFGALGDASMGPSVVRATAVPALGVHDAVGLALGGAHSCARRRNGAVWCWGVNNFGQLGDNSVQLRPTPIAVSGFP